MTFMEVVQQFFQVMLESAQETLELQKQMADVASRSHEASKRVSEEQLAALKRDSVERERVYAHNEDVRRFDREYHAHERAKWAAAAPTEER